MQSGVINGILLEVIVLFFDACFQLFLEHISAAKSPLCNATSQVQLYFKYHTCFFIDKSILFSLFPPVLFFFLKQAQEHHDLTKKVYEEIHNELKESLPSLYDRYVDHS